MNDRAAVRSSKMPSFLLQKVRIRRQRCQVEDEDRIVEFES